MIHKKQLTQFAKKILHSQKGLQNHQLMHPSREWAVGLFVALIIFSSSATWSALAYLEYSSGNITVDDVSPEQPVVYREAQVNAALEIFDQKSTQFETYFKELSPVLEEETFATSSALFDETATSSATSTETSEGATSTQAVAETDGDEQSEIGDEVIRPAVSF